jgi:hypothetical protein
MSDHVAASAPVTSEIVTVHGSDALSLAVNRTGPPTSPVTTGE